MLPWWGSIPPLRFVAVVGMRVAVECRRERATEVGEGGREPGELARVELVEDPIEDLLTSGLDLSEDCTSGVGDPHEDDPPVGGDAKPLDVAPLLDAIDKAGRVGDGDAEHLGEV